MTTNGPELNNSIETSAEETIDLNENGRAGEEINDTEIPPASTIEMDDAAFAALESQKDKLVLRRPPEQIVEMDDATLSALEAQKDKLVLPKGVAIENGTVKIAKKTPQKYIRIPKEKEQEIKDFLSKKDVPKPITVTKTAIAKEEMPNVPIEAIAIQHDKNSIKQFAYNMFHVIPQGVGQEVWITVTNPLFGPISPDQAINLAVWLVRLAMENGATITFGELKQVIDEMMDK